MSALSLVRETPGSSVLLVQEALGVLAELDALSRPARLQNLRRHPRLPYRRRLILRNREDEACPAAWIYGRDLSVSGMGCVHLESVNPGTAVLVHLPATDRKVDEIGARVAYCRHVKCRWHLTGLLFDQSIDPDRYLLAP